MGSASPRYQLGRPERGGTPGPRVVDLPQSPVATQRVARARGGTVAPDTAAASGRYPVRAAVSDVEAQAVGRRRGPRREFLAAAAGALFIAVALTKPWSWSAAAAGSARPSTAPSPAASVVLLAAAATPAPSASAWRSPVGWPDVPQWDYGWPVPDATFSAAPGGSTDAPDPRWPSVDWSLLATADEHSGWGFVAASLPDLSLLPAGAAAPLPIATWTSVGASRSATIDLGRGRQAYAVAITWPSDVSVRSVTVGFIAGPERPANMPPPGFEAFAQVSPLPAASIVAPGPGSAGAADSGATAAPPRPSGAATAPARAAATIVSGQFWIPPVDGSTISGSLGDSWRSQPWAWPDGIYTVTVTSNQGVGHYLLTIEST